jgi:predicted nucleic acid-binding Zn ribbon protein
MRRLAPRPLSHALAGFTAGLAPATTLARVQGCWNEVVGEGVGAESQPVSERDGVVTVACRSSVWAQELELLGPELVERVNTALGGGDAGGPVEALRFRVGASRG